MSFDKRKFIVDPQACVLPKGATFGDRRYRYKNWWCLSADEKRQVANQYPYNTPGIPDSAYAYPIDKNGRLPRARVSRTLIWSRQHIISRRAGQGLLGFSLWPFGKKKPKARAGSKTIYWVPGPGKGSAMTKRGHGVMHGARGRRRRRRR